MCTFEISKESSIYLPPNQQPVVHFAASELANILQKITGISLPVIQEAPLAPCGFLLSWDELGQKDGFSWQVQPVASGSRAQIRLHGDSPRGLLYAVYGFLEALGCRWPGPGEEWAVYPQAQVFDLPVEHQVETPAFDGRCLIIGHHAFIQQAPEWIIWAGRNRMNTLFFHTDEGPTPLGAASALIYRQQREKYLPLLKERGMVLELGGHGLTNFLPRKLFKQMPEAFRQVKGKRSPDHNFCVSNAEGMAIIQKNAEEYFHIYPEVERFHLWAEDIIGGGWCSCEKCRGLSASDQLLIATNAVAEVLEKVNPKATISAIAYHDTEDVSKIAPRHNVFMLWAPRKRCYAHATDDPDCVINVPRYAQTLKEQVSTFQRQGGAPSEVFEYYLDAILFKSLLPPLQNVMQKDLLFYQRAGVHTMQALMTGNAPWVSPQINAWIYARLCWNPAQNLQDLIKTFSEAVLGADISPYYQALEEAFGMALEQQSAPEEMVLELGIGGLMANPPVDMGDPFFYSVEDKKRLVVRNAAILEKLKIAETTLQAAQPAARPTAWACEAKAFDLYRAWLEFDYARLRVYEGAATGCSKAELKQRLDEAQAALNRTYAWGKQNIRDPRHQDNFRFFHVAMWQLRQDKIRIEQAEGGLSARLSQWGHVAEVIQAMTRLKNKLTHL